MPEQPKEDAPPAEGDQSTPTVEEPEKEGEQNEDQGDQKPPQEETKSASYRCA